MAIIQRPVQLQQLRGGPNFGQAIKAGLAGLQMGQQLGQRAQQQQQQQQLFDQQQAQLEQQQATRALQGQAIAGEQLLGAQSLAEAQAAISPLVDVNPEAAALLEGLQGGQITLDQAKQTASQALQGANAMGIFTPMQMRQQQQQEAAQQMAAEQAAEQREFQRKVALEEIKQAPKIAEQQQKQQERRREEFDKLITNRSNTQDLASLVADIKADPARKAATGASAKIPTFTRATKDFEAKFDRLVSALTLMETDKLTGPLTDKDMDLLKAAGAGLDLEMSEEAFLNRLSQIERKLTQGLKRADTRLARIDPEGEFGEIDTGMGDKLGTDTMSARVQTRRGVRQRNGATQEFVSPGGVNFTVSQL